LESQHKAEFPLLRLETYYGHPIAEKGPAKQSVEWSYGHPEAEEKLQNFQN
jgi:hypothetical protein